MKRTEIERPYFPVIIYSREDDKDDEAVIREMFTENVYRFDAAKLSKKPVVLDIGANIGTFTLLTLKVAQESGRAVTVYAVEPEKNNLELLKKNIEANPALFGKGSKVFIIENAVSNFEGVSQITNESGGSRLVTDSIAQDVSVITFDQLVEKIDKVDFTKIDIEGSEVPLIKGASQQSIMKTHYYAIEFDRSNFRTDFFTVIKPFLNSFSFETWGVPSNGCNIYLENHHWEKI